MDRVRRLLKCSAALLCSGVFAVLLTSPVCADAQRRPVASSAADENQIRQMVSKYAKSVDEASTVMAGQIWMDSPEVSFIHPRGHEHGFAQIKQNVYERLMGQTFSERHLKPRDVSVHVHGSAAWAEFYWDFDAKFRKDGSSMTTHGRETQVYWRTAQGWRLVHVHYSGMPVTQDRQGL